MMLKYVNKAKTAPENKTAINLPQKSNTLFFLLNIEIKPAMIQECMDRSTHSNKTQNITHLPFSLCAHGPVWLPWWRLQHRHSRSQMATLFTLRATLPYHASTYSPCVCAHPWQRRHTQSGTGLPGRSASAWSKRRHASLCLKASRLCSILGLQPSKCPLWRNTKGEREKGGGGGVKHRRPAQDAHTSVEAPVTVNH